jgi:DNA repair protein SbcD/Mre11
MKILHTADWHLGKYLHNFYLLNEQQYILDQLCEIVQQEKPDVILLAGDIYDRHQPASDAIEVFDKVMSRLVLEMKIPVIAIAGNHDSAERINYCNYLLREQGLHIFGSPVMPPKPVTLYDEYGGIDFYPIPFPEPENLRILLGRDKAIHTHESAMKALIEYIKDCDTFKNNHRKIAIAHAFVGGGSESDSERQLSVGNVSVMPLSAWEGFDYVALGHLHRPQSLGESRKVRYSGSILKYSLSEVHSSKSVTILDMDNTGKFSEKVIPLIPQKDVKTLKGIIKDMEFLANDNENLPQNEDFLEVTLENDMPVPNAMQIVQQKFPNTLNLKWSSLRQYNNPLARINSDKLSAMSEMDLFKDFFERHLQKDMDNDQKQILTNIIEEIRKQ